MKESEELRLARAAYLEKIAKYGAFPIPATSHYTAGYKDGSAILWAVANECANVERKAIEMAAQIAELKAENEQTEKLNKILQSDTQGLREELKAVDNTVEKLRNLRDELKRQNAELSAANMDLTLQLKVADVTLSVIYRKFPEIKAAVDAAAKEVSN